MTEDRWVPTCKLRWNRRADAPPGKFWRIPLGGIRRPVGYRLEQKWVVLTMLPDEPGIAKEEWRPVPFADECMESSPKLDTDDRQFWPVGPPE